MQRRVLRHGVPGAAARGAPRPGGAQRADLGGGRGQGGRLRPGAPGRRARRPRRRAARAGQAAHQVDRARGAQVQRASCHQILLLPISSLFINEIEELYLSVLCYN